MRRRLAMAALVVLAASCTGGDERDIAYGEVVAGTVTETVAAPASIQPRERVTISAPATGVVEELLVADGDRVRAGQVVARLGSPTLAQQVRQAEAAVAAAGALGNLPAGPDLGPIFELLAGSLASTVGPLLESLDQQADQVPDARARRELEASIDQAQLGYRHTLRQLESAAADARASAEQSDVAQRAAAAAQRAQAQAALDALRAQQEGLELTAPIAGTVALARGGSGSTPGLPGGLPAELGDLGGLAGPGTTATSDAPVAEGMEVSRGQPLLSIFDLSEFHATAQVDEVDAIDVEVGQAARVLVDALPDTELTGRVERVAIEPTVSGAGVTYDVVVELLDPPAGRSLRVGLTASVEIDVITVESETVVPTSALLRRGGQEVVYVRRDGRAVQIPVTVEAIGLDEAAVTGELQVGDQIVVRGVELVADGDQLP